MFITTKWVEVSISRCGIAESVVAYERDGQDVYIQLWEWLVVISWLT